MINISLSIYLLRTHSSIVLDFLKQKKKQLRLESKQNNNFFVERRPEGDYAVRKPNSERASAVEPTQAKAIEKARQLNPNAAVNVERVRNTNVGSPDKWRKP